jgi:hypothetical protein
MRHHLQRLEKYMDSTNEAIQMLTSALTSIEMPSDETKVNNSPFRQNKSSMRYTYQGVS